LAWGGTEGEGDVDVGEGAVVGEAGEVPVGVFGKGVRIN